MAITARGFDYSFSRPGLDCLRRSQHPDFVVRYITSLNNGKEASFNEIQALLQAGFQVAIVYQDGASDVLGGHNAGLGDARVADADCRRLGLDGIPVYFTLDRDPRGLSLSQRSAVRAYLDAVASVLGRQRVGLYGGYQAIEWFVPDHAAWGWQTYAWSGELISSKAHFRQYLNGLSFCGGQVDLNEAYREDFGQWPRPTATPEEPEQAPSEEDDDDMAFRVTYPGKPEIGVVGGRGVKFVDPENRNRWWYSLAAISSAKQVPEVQCTTEQQYDEYVAAFCTQHGRIESLVERLADKLDA